MQKHNNLIFYGNPNYNWLRIMFKFTPKCNYRCKYCDLYDNTQPHSTYEVWNGFLEFIQNIDTNTPLELLITGGEPTLHPDFAIFMRKLIDILNTRNTGTELMLLSNMTNKVSIYTDVIDRIKSKINLELYASYHKDFCEFNEFLNKCRQVNSDKFLLRIAYMIDHETDIDKFNELNIEFPMNFRPTDFKNEKIYKNDKALEDNRVLMIYLNESYELQQKRTTEKNFKNFVCLANKNCLYIDSFGKIFPCLGIKKSKFNVIEHTHSDILKQSSFMVCTSDFCPCEHEVPKFHLKHLYLLQDKERSTSVFNFTPGWFE